MHMEVRRLVLHPDFTIGQLWIDGSSFCYTLEDTVRETPNLPVEAWKIMHQTAIPVGSYKVILNFSNRFQRVLPLLLDVPGFRGVRIHTGNYPTNTSGCILVGASWDGKSGAIGQSQIAFENLMTKMANQNEMQLIIN